MKLIHKINITWILTKTFFKYKLNKFLVHVAMNKNKSFNQIYREKKESLQK